MPQGLLSGGLENAIRDAELSGKLAHELLPLRGLAVTLFLSTQLPSSCGCSRRRAAGVVGLCSSFCDQVSFSALAGRERFVAISGLAHLKRNNLAFASRLISSSTFWSRPARV